MADADVEADEAAPQLLAGPNAVPLRGLWTGAQLTDGCREIGRGLVAGADNVHWSLEYDATTAVLLDAVRWEHDDSWGLVTDAVDTRAPWTWVQSSTDRQIPRHARACRCRPHLCPHFSPAAVVYDYQTSHLLTEAAPTHVARAQTAYMAVPRFAQVCGSLYGGTLTYNYADSVVHLRWKGTGRTEWSHVPLFAWGGHYHDETTGTTFSSNVVTTCRDSVLLEVVKERQYVPLRGVWRGVLEGESGSFSIPALVGPVGAVVASDLVEWRGSEVAVWGPLILHRDARTRVHVVLDTTIVSVAAARMIGTPRNKDTWAGLVRGVRREVDKMVYLPAEHKPQIILLTSLLAFTAMAGPELYGLTALHAQDGRVWSAHDDALNFKFRRLMTPGELLGGVVSGLVGAGAGHELALHGAATLQHPAVAHVLVPAVCHTVVAATAVTALPSAVVVAAGAMAGVAAAMFVGKCTRALSSLVPRNTETSVTGLGGRPLPGPGFAIHHDDQDVAAPSTVVQHVGSVKHAATELVNRVVPPQRVGTLVEMPRELRESRQVPALALEGIGFAGLSQTYFASTPENEHQALVSRLTAAGPEPDDRLVGAAFRALARTRAFDRYRFLIAQDPPVSSTTNYSRWVARFPDALAKESRKERAEVLARGHFTGKDLQSGSFVKRETHSVDVEVNYVKFLAGKDPRGITTFSAALHAILGPMVFSAQRLFVRALRDEDGELGPLATAEMTAEEFGQWEAAAIEALTIDGVLPYIVSGDGERFDAKVRARHLKESRDLLFSRVRLSRLEISALKHLEKPGVKGRSRSGVRFVAKDVMGSGDDATALFDTVINAACQIHAMDATLEIEMWLAVQGDDMKAYLAAYVVDNAGGPEAFRLRAQQRSLDYGQKYTYKVSKSAWQHDFCACIVYPTEDGPVAGPVIGRALARSGWHLDWANDGNQTLRSMCIGRLQDCHHVPFLADYYRRVLELAGGPTGGRPKPGFHAARRHQPSDEVWDVITPRYGLTYADLVVFRQLLDRVVSLPAVVDWPPAQEMARIDAA